VRRRKWWGEAATARGSSCGVGRKQLCGGAARVGGGNKGGERQQGSGMQRQCGEATAMGGWESDARISVVVSEVASVLAERDEK